MVGQLILAPGGRGRTERSEPYGLPVLRARADPEGFWGPGRVRKAGRGLRRRGGLRLLAPRQFGDWDALRALGLRPVEPDGFLRGQSLPLTLEALARRGLAPDRATVALRGLRADREMARTAAGLCPLVRRLVVDAPRGGGELAGWLRREFGVPILPPGERGQVALRFCPECGGEEEPFLELFGPAPQLQGLTLTAPVLAEGDREDLPLLSALWEGGRLAAEDIKIT